MSVRNQATPAALNKTDAHEGTESSDVHGAIASVKPEITRNNLSNAPTFGSKL